MTSVFKNFRSRGNYEVATGVNPGPEDFKEVKVQDGETAHTTGSDTDSSSGDLYVKNEKEVQANPNTVTLSAQEGVQKAEATALVWSKSTIFAIYGWIWLCYFMLAFQQGIMSNLTQYIYADFSSAPAISTATILQSIVGGVLRLPIAKSINIFGRPETFAVFVSVYLVGIIILAASNSPDTYAAGYTIYWIGYDAIYLILDIFIADSFGLRNRALAFAFASTPFIITAFTAAPAAASIQPVSGIGGIGWRWGLGLFVPVNFCVMMVLTVVFKLYERKAIKMGIYKKEKSGRTLWQSTVHYVDEFGVIGGLLLCAAFVLFLLPFSLQSASRTTYDSATFIAMVVVGFCLFFVFAAYEKWLARVPFVKWELLKQSTVLGCCLLAAVLYFSFYLWDQYYYSYVKVTYALDLVDVGYMTQIYNVGSTFFSVCYAVYLHFVKKFKYTALLFGLPLMILGSGLMIHFRGGDYGIGYIIMCQIFIACAGGVLVISNEMAVMAASDREGIPMMLSLLYLFNSVGGAIGQAVAAAIYGNVWESAARSKLPEDMWAQVPSWNLHGYLVQEMYVPGTVQRTAFDYAWGQIQYYGCIASTAILVVGFPAIALWKNYKLDKKQNKGTVV